MKDHTPADGIAYPVCGSDDLNYYRMNGTYFDAYDPQAILDAMNESIAAGNDTFTFKFASGEIYARAREGLISDLFPEAAAHSKMVVFWNYQQ